MWARNLLLLLCVGRLYTCELPGDANHDGLPDGVSCDVDADGIPDVEDSDADGNGVQDIFEGEIDTDCDGIPDYIDSETKFDESINRGQCANKATIVTNHLNTVP